MAAFRLARIVTELRQKGAEIIKGKIRVVSTSRQLVEQFFRPAHAPRIVPEQLPAATSISPSKDRCHIPCGEIV